jgi:hypothetical protein
MEVAKSARQDSFGLPQGSAKRTQAAARNRTPSSVSMLLKQDANPVTMSYGIIDTMQKNTMNTNLELSGYTDKHRETVKSRYGTAEIFEIYAPSGRFVGFQIYLNNRLQYAPFMTLRGARATAKRILFK